jgi:thiamine-phosphate pyrophosphorylase
VTEQACRLYLISPPKIRLADFEKSLAAAFEGGDVACVQLRLKDTPDEDIRRAARVLMPIARDHNAVFLINDRPDLAAELDADGVHIGQQDTDYAAARALVGADAIVGVTCHNSRELAMQAAEKGADYVAFGAFFPTATKVPKTRADPELLTWWQDLFVAPCVAIGGITVANCGSLVQAGADFIAVVTAVWDHADGPAAAVAELNRAIDAAQD